LIGDKSERLLSSIALHSDRDDARDLDAAAHLPFVERVDCILL
jgi:hypothetical protein